MTGVGFRNSRTDMVDTSPSMVGPDRSLDHGPDGAFARSRGTSTRKAWRQVREKLALLLSLTPGEAALTVIWIWYALLLVRLVAGTQR